jgi:hypothetical protein
MELIQMNKYCNDFHNGENIFFCKIDHVINDFNYISRLKRNVVMIISNGDYTLTPEIMRNCPDNVKLIFATNNICNDYRVICIPTGVENEIQPIRIGHGEVNPEIFNKKKYLIEKEVSLVEFEDRIYANFSTPSQGCHLYSNYPNYRTSIKQICCNTPGIDFEYGLSIDDYFSKIYKYHCSISPIGNGIECIRTWETMYMNRVPIVIGGLNLHNTIYEQMYKNLPLLFIEDVNELRDVNLIIEKVHSVKDKSKKMMDYNYWKDFINEKIKYLNL